MDFLVYIVILAIFIYVMNALHEMRADKAAREQLRRRSFRRVAVVVDGENTPSWAYPQIEQTAAQLGRISVARVYADWGQPANAPWRKLIRRHGLEPVSVVPNVVGKDAVDITLALDAIEFLGEDIADIFIIASSDADFAPLYRRLRRAGKTVIVFGMPHTHASVKETCNEFMLLRRPLSGGAEQARSTAGVATPSPAATGQASTGQASAGQASAGQASAGQASTGQSETEDSNEILLKAHSDTVDGSGWAYASAMAQILADNGHLSRVIGRHESLSQALRASGLFETSIADRRMRVRRIENSPSRRRRRSR